MRLFTLLSVLACLALDPPAAAAAPSWQLVAPVTVGGLNLKTRAAAAGAFSGGVGLGLGIGQGWYAVVPQIAITISGDTKAPNFVNIAGLVGFAKYGVIGTMVHVEPAFSQWWLLAGLDVLKIASGAP